MFKSIFKPPVYREIARDVLEIDFLDEEYCEFIIADCEALNTWAPVKDDKFYSTQDINFQTELPELYTMISDYFNTEIVDIAGKFWGVDNFKVHNMFAIKYDMDGQKGLKQHHDDSFITASIKLNNSYKGAELCFPRQDFNNSNVKVGSILLFPGQITHPHYCTQLTQGTKYSLTIWTV